jgi:hypothetical protein
VLASSTGRINPDPRASQRNKVRELEKSGSIHRKVTTNRSRVL